MFMVYVKFMSIVLCSIAINLDAWFFDVFQYILHTSHVFDADGAYMCLHEAIEKNLRQVPPISGLHPFGAEANLWRIVTSFPGELL